ncbi:MAG TPA: cell wall metabolism sensor histidine kinase WalK [Candidatus Erysipelatoclostridium merdavium]|uniref:histidine kinase n=1 Tax=Candidatus Erysipelatoclostridium merdavium TaxID=2838566 RepID=A0A9D2BN00_9FIRM|nr:cell wall metabolism sensor histidine kinase WalK [Candidatus Erysipelatoclostridium merdavium]
MIVNKTIFRYFLTVLLITLILSSSVSMVILSNQLLENTEHDMLYAVKLIEYQLDDKQDLKEQVVPLNDLAYNDNTRLTIIDTDGDVLADSDEESIEENHRGREEVREALSDGVGYATRYSQTTHQNMLYVAVFNDDYIVRLSLPYDGIFDYLPVLIKPLGIGALISLVIALILSKRFANTLTAPLQEITTQVMKMKDYRELEFDDYKYDEFNIIAYKLEEQAKTIHDTMKTLKEERIKINGILDQMKEGFILLDSNFDVLMVNRKAQKLYGNTIKLNRSIKDFIFDFKIINALDHLSTERQIVEIEKEKEFYNCYVAKVDYGVTLLFVNVTEQHNSMKMRQEFFSNVSHELKTPITSIRGYSELLEAGVINDEGAKKKALDKIHDEVDNMSNLINDILMISRLENKDIDVIKHPVHLMPLVDEIVDTMQVEIDKRHLTVTKNVEDITYISNHQHMYQLLSNLITNAIKYNVENGSITIEAHQSETNIIIVVSDTGRGISKIDQGRVFERFFRCDQGRDKETGGTGLGLAIVKHIVQYYHGNIHLSSKLNEGTTFKIVLPMVDKIL